MTFRNVDGFELMAAVTQAGDGPYVPVITVKNPAGQLLRQHELQGFHHSQARAAEDHAIETLRAVTKVTEDGTLIFRERHD